MTTSPEACPHLLTLGHWCLAFATLVPGTPLGDITLCTVSPPNPLTHPPLSVLAADFQRLFPPPLLRHQHPQTQLRPCHPRSHSACKSHTPPPHPPRSLAHILSRAVPPPRATIRPEHSLHDICSLSFLLQSKGHQIRESALVLGCRGCSEGWEAPRRERQVEQHCLMGGCGQSSWGLRSGSPA